MLIEFANKNRIILEMNEKDKKWKLSIFRSR